MLNLEVVRKDSLGMEILVFGSHEAKLIVLVQVHVNLAPIRLGTFKHVDRQCIEKLIRNVHGKLKDTVE